MRGRLLVGALAPFFLCLPICRAQTVTNSLNIGTPTGAIFHGGDLDHVQLANGDLHLEIPLWSVPGRGLSEGAIYTYDDKGWIFHEYCNRVECTDTVTTERGSDIFGVITPVSSVGVTFQYVAPNGCPPNAVTSRVNYVVQEANATKHHMVPDDTGANPCSYEPTGIMYADDGSGWMINVNSQGYPSYAIDKNGTCYGASCLGATNVTDSRDRNGNQITYSSSSKIYTDTLGRNFPSTGSLNADGLSFYDSSGTLQTIQVTYTSVSIQTNFCIYSYADYCYEYSGGSPPLISTITMPNGMSYSFTYVQGDLGELASMTLPTGAQISWTWTDGDAGGGRVATRTVTANGQSATWTYGYQYHGGLLDQDANSIVDPLGNETDFSWVSNTCYPATYYCSPGMMQVASTKYYSGPASGGQLLKTVATDYSTSIGPVLPIRTTTTWNQSNLVKKEETDWDSFSAGSFNVSARNPVSFREYDWGSGAPGGLLRTTTYYWLHLQNSAYRSANLLGLPVYKTVYDGSGTVAQTNFNYDGSSPVSTAGTPAPNHDYTYFGSGNSVRGNLTQVQQWLKASNAWLNTTHTYDDLGNRLSTTDPAGNTTTFSYTDNFTDNTNRNSQGLVTQITHPVTNGVNHIERMQYFFYPSLLAASCGQNFPAGSICNNSYSPPQPDYTKYSYDVMGRPTTIVHADGGQNGLSYNDTSPPLSITSSEQMTGTTNLVKTTVFDDLARVKQTQLNSDPSGVDYVDTTYDKLGRVASVSNPYRSTGDPTYGITTYAHDAVGRTIKVTDTDGSAVNTAYSGNCATVTDEQGKNRQSCTDGLGRLTTVIENPGGLGYTTTYGYDALDNLTSVLQNGSRSRSFVYDSLSRLTSATNPESGTVTNTYDSNGNVLTKTDARGITITYTYDALNRLTKKAYSNGSASNEFYYDAANQGYSIGRLTHASNDVNAASNPSYDAMGRVINTLYCIPSDCNYDKSTSATYDLAGDMTSYTNGAGITFTQTFNAAQQLTQIASSWIDSQHPGTLATFSYSPFGAVKSISYGNALTETAAFNSRLQPCRINTNSTATLLNTCTDSVPSGNLLDLSYNWNAGTSDNGNVMGWTAAGNQTFGRNYTYDALNRLASMTDSDSAASCLGLTWGYDAWGNRTAQTPTRGTCGMWSSAYTANNQIVGYSYDAVGNLLNDGTHTYTYDAENRITAVDGGATATYVYDAGGNRVSKTAGGVESDYIRDLSGNVITVFGAGCGSGCWARGYVYMGSDLVAEYGDSTTYFIHRDHLGSTRLMTAMNQSVHDSIDYLPFGEQIAGDTGTTHKFTGKERDSESNLDNFGARYNSSQMGRFMSPDPLGGKLIDPQTLNKYSYVRNNPINLTDPTGLYTCADQADCKSKQDIAFEKARQQDLKSKDSNVVRAANAYGDPTKDNGVGVQFGDPGNGRDANTTSGLRADPNDPNKIQAAETVTIKSGLSGSALDAAAGHEGSHVADAQDFASTINMQGGFDASKNLSTYQTELKAYMVTQSILSSENTKFGYGDCGLSGPCVLGAGIMPAQALQTINQLLANPANRYGAAPNYGVTPANPGPVLYPSLTTPH